MEKKGRLEVLTGPHQGEVFELNRQTFHIGRSGDNDIVLEDHQVSRHHAQLSYEKGTFYLIDLNTANGSLVNQKRVLNQKLNSGDIIQIGQQRFRFMGEGDLMETTQGGTPQREKISRMPTVSSKKPSPFRIVLVGMGGLVVLLLVWFIFQPTPHPSSPQEPQAETSSRWVATEGPAGLPELKKEAFTINRDKANRFYDSGYRELLSENYLRAIDDFKSALELYPDHRLAKLHLERTEEALSQAVDKHYKAGINYFNSGNFSLSIFHFQKVMQLLVRRRPEEKYCELRLERQIAVENPDHSKYCDAKQKIEEAQEQLSAP